MNTPHDRRTALLEKFLDAEHFRFQRNQESVVSINEIALDASWSLHLKAALTELTRQMLADFKHFCRQCMSVSLEEATEGEKSIVWEIRDPLLPPIDTQNPEFESFEIQISAGEIRILARHERGLLHGTHYLEWKMANRGGPFLSEETLARKPAFMPRISNGAFINGHQTFASPGRFTDEYLSLMSHYGSNGIHLYVNLWNVFKNDTLAELNSVNFEKEIVALRAFNERTIRYGIDLYLHINAGPLDENHPVFSAHPEIRGAKVEIFIEGLSGRPWHNLCSGSGKVKQAYSEAIANLFTAAPEVAGMMMITGGECFYHCFTRPADSENGDTNCPHCHGKDASLEVAALVNIANKAIKSTGPRKALYAWPYSAFIWSKKDPHLLRWLEHLDHDVSVLANFDSGDLNAYGVRLFDYNITCIGPCEIFSEQAKTLAEQGKPIFAKVETCTTPDAFFLPYLPFYQRWQQRIDSMKQSGVAGFIGQWRFYGMNASPPEELQYRAIWDETSCEEALLIRGVRDFGLTSSEAGLLVSGWAKLSKAWDSFPYSSMTAGERQAYMRGPFYLGPAHPLIFDVQDRYGLPDAFFSLRGDLGELEVDEIELKQMRDQSRPRYVSDLLVTLPYGVEEYKHLLNKCRKSWAQGMAEIQPLLHGRGQRAQMELDVCSTIQAHLRTLANVVDFYHARDILQNSRSTPDDFKAGIRQLSQIVDDEIQNAEMMLPILHRDFRIGYGYCYGPAYDASMVEAKIAQCRTVRDVELPRFSTVIRFHVWHESP